jgi:predicted O-linked N-acetylglucosamine transferase (SPINDLY family)
MPTDNRTLAALTPSRPAAGLPEHGFVFCDFNKSNKLTPEMFDIWMRILREVGDSVLWLNVDNTTARNNLRAEVEARGVAAQRLIFAERAADRAQHLARLALADLFLDTLPYNAHATASDFLRAGVPVLTCMGQSFASRVAGSMLLTMGVEELIARDLAQYEIMALKLARTPQLLAGLRSRLAASRTLFDTEGLTRNLETAYEKMWDLHLKGQSPESFSVQALR